MIKKVYITDVSESDLNKIFSAIGSGVEEYNGRAFFQHVGFSSIPKEGAIGIVLKSGDNYTVIASTDTIDDRPNLSEEGETVLYSDADKYVKIKPDGDILINNNSNTVTLKANGDIELGSGALSNLMKDSIITKFNTHTHVCASPGSPSAVPSALFLATDATSKVSAQ